LDVADAIHHVLVEAQDVALRKHPECPEWLIRLVLKMHSSAALVISLNYDTLLEMAAAELCFGGSDVYLSENLRPFAFPAREGYLHSQVPRTFQLFKLHGSLHWTYSGTEEYFGQTIEDSNLPRWSVAAGNKLPFVLDDGKVPLIVPPTLNKSKYFDNEKVRWLWRRAALALSSARRVFCVGYSLPAGDLLMRLLLHDCKPPSGREVPFWLVNSDGCATNDYSQALPSWYSLRDTYTCDQDFKVVARFASDFVNGRLDGPMGNSPTAEPARGIAPLVQQGVCDGSSHRSLIDDKDFEVLRVNNSGLLLPDADGGTRFLPWIAFEGILLGADRGEYNPWGQDDDSIRLFLGNKLGAEWDRQVFTLLVKTGALVKYESEGKVRFKSLPGLIGHTGGK
jgi:hypothetical protein